MARSESQEGAKTMTNQTAYITGTVIRETDKAVMLNCQMERGDEPVSGGVWFPRSQIERIGSQIEVEAARNPGFAEVLRRTGSAAAVYSVPVWLARKAGVCHATRL